MITIISALSQNKVIGKNNKISWQSKEDLERFRQIITGKTIVMGRKTFESLKNYFPDKNGHPLAGKNIVLSESLKNISGIEIYKTPKEILEKYKNTDLYIIGGAEIYKTFLPFCDQLDLTIIPGNYDGDSFFPDFENEFKLVSEEKGKREDLVFQKWGRQSKIFLSLGSNIGDKELNLKKAISLLENKVSNITQSKIYKTKPFGETNQDNFLNMAIFGYTDLKPEKLLEFIKSIENEIGRTKTYRWGPRIIDIDILFYDNEIIESENLIIPHIGIEKRDFVLKPLLDLAPDFIHPKLNKTIKELYEKLDSKTFTII